VRVQFAEAWAKQPRTDLGIPAQGASVIVAKFNDYECPTCRQGETLYQPVFDQFAASHPGAVRLVLKDYPLNSQCNVQVSNTIPGHEAACIAAAAARVASERGKFEEMTNWIWMNQGTSETSLRQAATRILGITETELDREYLQKLPAIRQDVADGGALNITGTPTYFINGVRLPSAIIPVEYFRLAIELELEKAGAEAD
jgi:protein-disulfide isomerase